MCKSFLATSLFHFVHYWTLEHGHWKIFYFTVNLSICSFIFLFLSSLRVYTSMCFVYVCGFFWPVCSCFRRRGLPIRGFTEIADPRIFQLPSYCIAASSHYREFSLFNQNKSMFLSRILFIHCFVQKLWNRIIFCIKDFISFFLCVLFGTSYILIFMWLCSVYAVMSSSVSITSTEYWYRARPDA